MTDLMRRELKEDVKADFLNRLKKAIAPYGSGRVLAAKAGITYQGLADVIKQRKATKTTVVKLTTAMNSLEK